MIDAVAPRCLTKDTFERLGREDPLWAVLTVPEFRNNRWDPDAFFETGRHEINGVMAYLDSLGLDGPRELAMDFGCGVGRLSQALCEHLSGDFFSG